MDEDAEESARRREGAALVRAATTDLSDREHGWSDPGDPRVGIWDTEIARLLEEQQRLAASEVEVPWPSSLSATAVMAYRRDPEALLRSVVRPLPREPSRAARFGTRFHDWVERQLDPRGALALVDLTDLPGREDADVADEAELVALAQAFLASPFGQRVDGLTEVPFALSLAGVTVRGRIDAVFPEGDGWLIVDWKTNREHDADPVQLALYREAWADLKGLSPDHIRVAFFYVRDGALVEPADLPTRRDLERLVGGA